MVKRMVSRWINDQNGSTAIEYGLIVAGVCLAIATAVFTFGDSMEEMYANLSDLLG